MMAALARRAFVPRGVYTALVTPFDGKGCVDWRAYEALIEMQVAGGVAGIVACGTTAESPTLSHDEKHRLIADAVRVAAGRIHVLAGTGSNATADTVAHTLAAKAAGADACLLVSPYYNRPTQAGLIAHVRAVAACNLPIMLYNIPGRCGVNMLPATVAELWRTEPMVTSIKEASGSVDQACEIASLCDIPILSGDDALTLPMMSVGAVGVVSVASNLLPAEVVALAAAADANDLRAARSRHHRLFPLFRALFCEPNPVPVKRAMAAEALLASPEVRLPLTPLTPESDALVLRALAAFRATVTAGASS